MWINKTRFYFRNLTFLAVLLLAGLQSESMAGTPKKILLVTVTMNWRHASIPAVREMIRELGASSGEFTVDYIDQPPAYNQPGQPSAQQVQLATPIIQAELKTLTSAWLTSNHYDAVVFASTSGELPVPDLNDFLSWIKNGHAFIGIHEAIDNFGSNLAYSDMIGSGFVGHGNYRPTINVFVADSLNPSTSQLYLDTNTGVQPNVGTVPSGFIYQENGGSALPPVWQIAQDEFYHTQNFDSTQNHVLLWSNYDSNYPHLYGQYPLAWCKYYGTGKVFYTAIGHLRDMSSTGSSFPLQEADDGPNRINPLATTYQYRAHVLGGIEWALGIKSAAIAGVPTSLTASAGSASVGLTWSAAVADNSYNIKRSTTQGSGYSSIGTSATTSYTDNTAANGTTYYYVVTANDGGGLENTVSSNEANAKPLNTSVAIPLQLKALVNQGQIRLTWTATPGATSYTVKRSTTSGRSYGILTSSNSTTAYTDSNVTIGKTYYYVVTANIGGSSSPYSAEASATPPPAAPGTPSTNPGNLSVSLTWAASSGATSYNIYRSTTSGTGYIMITAPNRLITTSYTDNAVANGIKNYYVVTAVAGAGESAYSTEGSTTPEPGVPGLLNAYPGNGCIGLNWAAATGATSYNIKRSTTSGSSYAQYGSSTSTSFTDNSASNGTNYYYVVTAVGGGGESSTSTQASAKPLTTLVAIPTALKANAGDTSVALTWTAAAGATSYNVKRSTVSGSGYSTISTANSVTTTNFTDKTGVNGTTYYYVVTSVSVSGESPNSSEVTATPQSPVPNPPTNLVATAITSTDSSTQGDVYVTLTWGTSSGATSYNIYRTTTNGSGYDLVGTAASNNFTDYTVENGMTYYYVVTAVNSGGQSTNSNQPSTATPAILATAPSSLTATPGNASVALTWPASTGATSYNVKRSTTSGTGYTTISTANFVTTTSYTDNTAQPGSAYYYVVSAVNGTTESTTNSPEKKAVPNSATIAVPSSPINPKASGLISTSSTTLGDAYVALSWTASSEATLYNILRSTTSGSGYSLIGQSTASTFTDSGVVNGRTYYYVIAAVNGAGTSANSTQSNASVVPATPGSVTATLANSSVSLVWPASTGATSYNVYRSTTSGTGYTTISTANTVITPSYNDNTATIGSTYYYVVTAVNGGGESSYSPEANITPVGANNTDSPTMPQWGLIVMALLLFWSVVRQNKQFGVRI